MEVGQGARSATVLDAAHHIIAAYNEAKTAPAAARKIYHFIGQDIPAAFLGPSQSGVHLFVAALSAELSLDHDHILRIIDLDSALPLIVMFAAAGLSKTDALNLVLDIRSKKLSAGEAAFFDTEYPLLTETRAKQEISDWSAARSSLLAFGRL